MFKKLFRFSLKTFLILVLFVGTLGAWVSNHHFHHQKEWRVVEKLMEIDSGNGLFYHDTVIDVDSSKRISAFAGMG